MTASTSVCNSVVIGSAVIREVHNRAMLAGFIRIEAAQVVFWMRRIHLGACCNDCHCLIDKRRLPGSEVSSHCSMSSRANRTAASTSGTVNDENGSAASGK